LKGFKEKKGASFEAAWSRGKKKQQQRYVS